METAPRGLPVAELPVAELPVAELPVAGSGLISARRSAQMCGTNSLQAIRRSERGSSST